MTYSAPSSMALVLWKPAQTRSERDGQGGDEPAIASSAQGRFTSYDIIGVDGVPPCALTPRLLPSRYLLAQLLSASLSTEIPDSPLIRRPAPSRVSTDRLIEAPPNDHIVGEQASRAEAEALTLARPEGTMGSEVSLSELMEYHENLHQQEHGRAAPVGDSTEIDHVNLDISDTALSPKPKSSAETPISTAAGEMEHMAPIGQQIRQHEDHAEQVVARVPDTHTLLPMGSSQISTQAGMCDYDGIQPFKQAVAASVYTPHQPAEAKLEATDEAEEIEGVEIVNKEGSRVSEAISQLECKDEIEEPWKTQLSRFAADAAVIDEIEQEYMAVKGDKEYKGPAGPAWGTSASERPAVVGTGEVGKEDDTFVGGAGAKVMVDAPTETGTASPSTPLLASEEIHAPASSENHPLVPDHPPSPSPTDPPSISALTPQLANRSAHASEEVHPEAMSSPPRSLPNSTPPSPRAAEPRDDERETPQHSQDSFRSLDILDSSPPAPATDEDNQETSASANGMDGLGGEGPIEDRRADTAMRPDIASGAVPSDTAHSDPTLDITIEPTPTVSHGRIPIIKRKKTLDDLFSAMPIIKRKKVELTQTPCPPEEDVKDVDAGTTAVPASDDPLADAHGFERGGPGSSKQAATLPASETASIPATRKNEDHAAKEDADEEEGLVEDAQRGQWRVGRLPGHQGSHARKPTTMADGPEDESEGKRSGQKRSLGQSINDSAEKVLKKPFRLPARVVLKSAPRSRQRSSSPDLTHVLPDVNPSSIAIPPSSPETDHSKASRHSASVKARAFAIPRKVEVTPINTSNKIPPGLAISARLDLGSPVRPHQSSSTLIASSPSTSASSAFKSSPTYSKRLSKPFKTPFSRSTAPSLTTKSSSRSSKTSPLLSLSLAPAAPSPRNVIIELEKEERTLRQAIKYHTEPEEDDRLEELITLWREAGQQVAEMLFAIQPRPDAQADGPGGTGLGGDRPFPFFEDDKPFFGGTKLTSEQLRYIARLDVNKDGDPVDDDGNPIFGIADGVLASYDDDAPAGSYSNTRAHQDAASRATAKTTDPEEWNIGTMLARMGVEPGMYAWDAEAEDWGTPAT